MKQLATFGFALVLLIPLAQAADAGLPAVLNGGFACIASGSKKIVTVGLGKEMQDLKGGVVTKPGMVGYRVGNGALAWGSVESSGTDTFKVTLQGRKPITVKQTRVAPANEFEDTKPFFTISEEGGKTYACGFGGAGE